MADALTKDLRRRMDGALEALKKEFSGLRTGRASASLLDPVMVDAYGSSMPLAQCGTVSAPEPLPRNSRRSLTLRTVSRSAAATAPGSPSGRSDIR